MKRILTFLKEPAVIVGLFFIFLILMSGGVSASPGIYKQKQDINLLQTCSNCSFVNITSITLPNGTKIIGNVPMTKDGNVFNYTLNGLLTQSLGTYRVNGIGNPDGTNEIWVYSLDVTYYGIKIQEGQSTIYIVLLIILIFFMVILFWGINQLPSSNQRDEEGRILSITYLKYFRPIGWIFEYMLVVTLLYLSSNLAFAYLNEQLFAKILFVLFRLSFMLAPLIVIVWIIWIFVSLYHDRQMQNLLNRGFFPQGKL